MSIQNKMERDVGEIGEDNLSFSIKLKEDCDRLSAKLSGSKQAQEQHENNELHQYCRSVDYYLSLGIDKRDAMLYASWNYKGISQKMNKSLPNRLNQAKRGIFEAR